MNTQKYDRTEEFKGSELKADRALRDTARSYLAKTPIQIDVDQIESAIRLYPLQLMGVALALGFVAGKLARGTGVVILAALGRSVARETAGNFARRLVGRGRA